MPLYLADSALGPCVTGKYEGGPGRDGEPGSLAGLQNTGPSGSTRLAWDDLAVQTKLFQSFKLTYFSLVTNDQCLTSHGSCFAPKFQFINVLKIPTLQNSSTPQGCEGGKTEEPRAETFCCTADT